MIGVMTPERRKMPENKNGKRIGLYISEELLARCDAAISKTNATSRSEFVCDAVDIKTVSGMLGHFSAGFTLDTYAHVTTAAQKEAAQTMGNILSI